MTKAELIERIAHSRDLPPAITKKDIAAVLGLAFEELAAYFAKAKVTRSSSPRFTFPRFGTFSKKKRSARRGVNPRTLEPMQIDACHTLDFKASRELREDMNHGALPRSKSEASASASPSSPPVVKAKPKTKRVSKSKGAAATATARSSKASKTKTSKTKASKTKASKAKAANGRRLLTPRDEEAELDALIDDEKLFEEPTLPAASLQRVRTRNTGRTRVRSTG